MKEVIRKARQYDTYIICSDTNGQVMRLQADEFQAWQQSLADPNTSTES
jgi:hypothetical protein